MKKLDGIEAGRGIAALLVVLVHATSIFGLPQNLGVPAFSGLFKFGHAGVDFFFVLSGFIIYYIHHHEFNQPKKIGAYWQKRFVRIVPTYWVVLAIYGCILLVSPTKELYEREIDTILRSVFLLPGGNGQILGVAWTLTHELLFYGLFAVLLINRRVGQVFFAIWFVLLLAQLIFGFTQHEIWAEFVLRLFNLGFFLGMLAAKLLIAERIKHERWLIWGGISLFFSAGIYESFASNLPNEWWLLHACYLIGSTSFICGIVSFERRYGLNVPHVLLVMGKSSYSIYLTHVIVLMILAKFCGLLLWLPADLIFVICVVGTVIAGAIFSRYVEFPLIKFVNGLFRS
jgi:peptidoglycan/LPS O-acetylase OafA/YrhL